LKWGTGAINIDAARFAYGDDCHFGKDDPPRSEKVRPRCGSNEFGKVLSNIGMINYEVSELGRFPANVYQCSKPQRSEKEQGLDHLSDHISAAVELHGKDSKGLNSPRAGAGRTAENVKNFHPTVKPIKLMRWLCRLLTPKGGVVLDPFLGSGTTAVSAILEGFNAVGCEMTEDYYPIIQGRVNWAKLEREKQISGEDK
jgi:site-specific DNA-methyltransferase (adenine-specific)